VKERIARAAVVMGQVWSIGKRKFEKDLKKRIWLFDALVGRWQAMEWKYGGGERERG